MRRSGSRKRSVRRQSWKRLPPALLAAPIPHGNSKLTMEVIEAVCHVVSMGESLVTAAEANFLQPATLHAWRRRGEEERAQGVTSIYVEFTSRLEAAEPRGRVALKSMAHRAVEEAIPEPGRRRLAPQHARVQLEAGKLAVQLLAAKEAGRVGAEKRWSKGEEEPPEATPAPGPRPVDLARLTAEEAAELRRLLRKARGEEPC